jgi:hypothetical protein
MERSQNEREVRYALSLSSEEKQHQRWEVSTQAFAEFELSKRLVRAREAARCDGSPAMLKALEEAQTGWERAGRPKAPGHQGGLNTRAR